MASLAALGVLDRLTTTSAAQDQPAAAAQTVTGNDSSPKPGQVDQSQSVQQSSPVVQEAVHQDVSLPLFLLPPAPRQAGQRVLPVKPIPRRINGGAVDPVVQESVSTILAPTPIVNFDGVGNGFSGPNGTFTVNSAPPDTNGDVGPNHYVQIVNTDFAVFSKSGTAVYGPVPINTLWSGFGGGCEANNDGDPVVLYDPIADRWVISQFSVKTTPYLQCVAVSQTGDPIGTYNRYSFQYSDFPDYPKMGVWPDAYYITFNMFAGGTTFSGGQVCAYDRASMLTGAAATQQCFNVGTNFGGLLPADVDGARQPPAGSPNYVLALGASANQLVLWKFHVDWTTPANTILTGPTTLATAAFSEACGGGTCIPQSGTKQRLDSLADRLMFRLAYRNFGDHEALVVNHSVTAGSSVGVRWYEIRSPGTTPTIYQQGTYAPDSNFRWMGSIAMDQSGNMALGFSVSGSAIHPEIHYTGRLATDALGTMTQGESALINGTGSQTRNLSRWGDYSMMAVDPSDDCTFWYTNEYIPANGTFNWKTRIGSFKFPGCGAPPSNDFSISATPNSLSIQQGASGTSTISTAVTSGSAETVSLSVSGVPSGASASLNPTSVTAGGSSTLTVNAGTAAAGTYTLSVTGTAASATHATSVTLMVTAPPPISVSVNPTSASVQVSQTANFTASVLNDPANKGVNWSLSGAGCSGITCGTLTSVTTTSVTYNAPASVPSPATVTLTATSIADGTKSAAATITVTAPPPISVSVNPTSASVQVSQTANFTASVLNDPANKGVNWSLSGSGCSGITCGTLTSVTTTSVTYNAPASVPSPATATLTATSIADGTKSAAATITVTAPPPISVSVNPTSASVQVSQTANFTASVLNDPANKGVSWSLSGAGCSGITCGTLTSVTTTSVTYNAPASVPSPATVTLTATSIADGTKSAAATITITAPPPISVSVNPTSASVQVSQTKNFTASVLNDPANKGVSWSLSGAGCSGNTCGTLTSVTTTSVTYNAPASVPSPATVTLTATSIADVSKSAAATITVTPVVTAAPVLFVRGAGNDGFGTSVRADFVSNTAGNLLIVSSSWDSVAASATISDTAGNTWTAVFASPVLQPNGSYPTRNQIWYARNCKGSAGVNTVTLTYNASTSFADIELHEYSGADTTNPLDLSASSTPATDSVNPSLTTGTTNFSNELVFGMVVISTGAPAAGTGYTLREQAGNTFTTTEDANVTATGAQTVRFTNGLSTWALLVATFR